VKKYQSGEVPRSQRSSATRVAMRRMPLLERFALSPIILFLAASPLVGDA